MEGLDGGSRRFRNRTSRRSTSSVSVGGLQLAGELRRCGPARRSGRATRRPPSVNNRVKWRGSSPPRRRSAATRWSAPGVASRSSTWATRDGLAVGSSGPHRSGELRLAARAVEEHHQPAGHVLGHVAAEVVLHQCQGEIDAGGHPGRRPHIAVAPVDRVGIDGGRRELGGQAGGRAPSASSDRAARRAARPGRRGTCRCTPWPPGDCPPRGARPGRPARGRGGRRAHHRRRRPAACRGVAGDRPARGRPARRARSRSAPPPARGR